MVKSTNANTYLITVRQHDLNDGTETILVDSVAGIKEAARIFGSSPTQMSRYLNGRCSYGARNNTRFVYEFNKRLIHS